MFGSSFRACSIFFLSSSRSSGESSLGASRSACSDSDSGSIPSSSLFSMSATIAPLKIARPTIPHMEENPFGGLFGDPDDMQRRLSEFAEQMQGAQRVAWADNAIKLAVDMTVAAIQTLDLNGTADEQAAQVR